MIRPSPQVLVVDDDPSVRKSFARLLGSAGYEVETFASAREFLERPPAAGPCCVVLDVRMPGMTGIDLQAALAASGRRVSIVFVSGHVDVPASVKAMKDGAVDVLTKPVDEKDLLEAIQRAVDRDDQARVEGAQIAEIRERVATLTPREGEVLALVVVGKLNKQIASELGMGEKTVKVHRARVMRKMRADSLADLVRLADRAGVVAPRREA
jgi:FixJ family two-component response regulator